MNPHGRFLCVYPKRLLLTKSRTLRRLSLR